MNLLARFRPVAQRVVPGARLIDVRPLPGGMSAEITVLELEHPDGGPQTLVVREYGPKNVAADAHPAGTETGLLQHLLDAGLPVPRPWYADDSAELLDGPFSVIDFIVADPPPADWSAAAAAEFVRPLIRLHELPPGPTPLRHYIDRVDRWLTDGPAQPDESMRETVIRERLGAWWPEHTEGATRILHGDFWPGNTLWRDGRLVSVIDWEDAAVGDVRSDLANLRLELVWAYGPEAAVDFTERYAAAAGPDAPDLSELPYWDLVAATRPVGRLHEWGLDPLRMDVFLTRFQEFVDAALAITG
ncbi:MAG TPA: phosphotransferase [Microlunatus sp.]